MMSLGRERPPSKTTNVRTNVFIRDIQYRKATTQQSYDIRPINASRCDHEKQFGGDEIRSQFGNDANLEINVFPYVFFVQAHHMPGSKNSSGVYRPKYKKLRTSHLSRSAHVADPGQVRNGYGRARCV